MSDLPGRAAISVALHLVAVVLRPLNSVAIRLVAVAALRRVNLAAAARPVNSVGAHLVVVDQVR